MDDKSVMPFEEALSSIKEGWFISRPSWGDKSIGLHKPKYFAEIKIEFIYEEIDGIMKGPYSASNDDLLADDFFTTVYKSN